MKRTGDFGVRLLAVALFTIPLVVLAEVVQKHELRIAIDDGSADGQLFVNLDDAASGIDLASLQVGESQSIVDESGRRSTTTAVDSPMATRQSICRSAASQLSAVVISR